MLALLPDAGNFLEFSRARRFRSSTCRTVMVDGVYCLFQPARRAFVQLDVAAAGSVATQAACGGIAVGQRDAEGVVAARFAVVAGDDVSRARIAVNRHVVSDITAVRVAGIGGEADDIRGLHVHSGSVVNVIQMTPELAEADAAAHGEGAFRT